MREYHSFKTDFKGAFQDLICPWLKKNNLWLEPSGKGEVSSAPLFGSLNQLISAPPPGGLVQRPTADFPLKGPAAPKTNEADSRSVLVASVEDHERIWFAEEVFLVQLVGAELQSGAVLQGHMKRRRSVWEVDTEKKRPEGRRRAAASALCCSFLLFQALKAGGR